MNFIYIADVDDDHFMAITPNCKAKVLEFKLFSNPLVGNSLEFIDSGIVTESQINAHEQYNAYREQDLNERIRRLFEGWSKLEIQALIAIYKKKKEKQKKSFQKGDHENENN